MSFLDWWDFDTAPEGTRERESLSRLLASNDYQPWELASGYTPDSGNDYQPDELAMGYTPPLDSYAPPEPAYTPPPVQYAPPEEQQPTGASDWVLPDWMANDTPPEDNWVQPEENWWQMPTSPTDWRLRDLGPGPTDPEGFPTWIPTDTEDFGPSNEDGTPYNPWRARPPFDPWPAIDPNSVLDTSQIEDMRSPNDPSRRPNRRAFTDPNNEIQWVPPDQSDMRARWSDFDLQQPNPPTETNRAAWSDFDLAEPSSYNAETKRAQWSDYDLRGAEIQRKANDLRTYLTENPGEAAAMGLPDPSGQAGAISAQQADAIRKQAREAGFPEDWRQWDDVQLAAAAEGKAFTRAPLPSLSGLIAKGIARIPNIDTSGTPLIGGVTSRTLDPLVNTATSDTTGALVGGIAPWLLGPEVGLADSALRTSAAYEQGGIVPAALEVGNAALMGTNPLQAALVSKVAQRPISQVLANAGLQAAGGAGMDVAAQLAENGDVDWRRTATQAGINAGLPLVLGAPTIGREALAGAGRVAQLPKNLHDAAIALDARINEPVPGSGEYTTAGMEGEARPPKRPVALEPHEVVATKWADAKARNSSLLEKDLASLESQGYDVSDVRAAIDDYRSIERRDYADADEYSGARSDAWDEIVGALDAIEPLDVPGPGDVLPPGAEAPREPVTAPEDRAAAALLEDIPADVRAVLRAQAEADGDTAALAMLDAAERAEARASGADTSVPSPDATETTDATAPHGVPAEAPPEAAGAGEPPKPPVEPLFQNAGGDEPAPVPFSEIWPLGTEGAEKALAAKAKGLDPAAGSKLPKGARRLVGYVNPAADTTMDIQLRNRAAGGVRSEMHSVMSLQTNPIAKEFRKSVEEQKPVYIGEAPTTNGQKKIIGSDKDIIERPSAYILANRTRQAIKDLRDTMDSHLAVLRTQYGVDIGRFTVPDPDGAYLPTARDLGDFVHAVERNQKQYGVRAAAKERVYETGWERMANENHAGEKMITNLHDLLEMHNAALASDAGNATFRLDLGKSRSDLLRETHPELVAQHDALVAKIASLRKRVVTAEKRAGINTRASDELDKALAEIENRVPEGIGQVARVGTELANQNERAGELLGPKEGPDRVMTPGGPVRMSQVPGDNTVPATPLDIAKGEAMGRVVDAVARHIPNDIEDVRFLENAIDRSYRRADELGKRGGKYEGDAAAIKAELGDVLAQWEEFAPRWRNADPTAGTDYVRADEIGGKYVPSETYRDIQRIGARATGPEAGILNFADYLRAVHFSGDGSPISIQGLLGVMSRSPVENTRSAVMALTSPVNTVHAVLDFIKSDPIEWLASVAKENPEDVKEFSFSMNRPWTTSEKEFPLNRGLMHIKGLRGFEEHNWALAQRVTFNLWRNERNRLLKDGASRAAANEYAAQITQNLVPLKDPTIRALSPRRAAYERFAFTSTSFATAAPLLIKDTAIALGKLAAHAHEGPDAWANLNPRDQATLRRALNLSANLVGISAITAAASASSRGMSPEDAIRESLDPNSKFFLSFQFGDGRKVGIGGPLRSFAKAVMQTGDNGLPGAGLEDWARSKANPIVDTALNLHSDRDFYGDPIRNPKADWGENLLRSLWYAGENTYFPTAVGVGSRDVRKNEASSKTAWEALGQLGGLNYSPPTNTDRMREDYRRSGGQGDVLNDPKFTREWRLEHGYQPTSNLGKELEAKTATVKREQAANDDLAMSGKIDLGEWRKQRRSLDTERRTIAETILGDSDFQKEAPKGTGAYWMRTWAETFDKAKKENGSLDSAKLDQLQGDWLAENGRDALDYVNNYLGLGKSEIEAQYLKDTRELKDLGYFSMKKYVGMVSGKSEDELEDLRQRVLAKSREDRYAYTNGMSVEDKAFMLLPKIGVTADRAKLAQDVGNIGKHDFQRASYQRFKSEHKRLLGWFTDDNFYANVKQDTDKKPSRASFIDRED